MICYVRGCHQPAILGAVHKHFGRVESCSGHHPDRVGYARPISGDGTPAPAPVALDHFAVPVAPRSAPPVLTVPQVDDRDLF